MAPAVKSPAATSGSAKPDEDPIASTKAKLGCVNDMEKVFETARTFIDPTPWFRAFTHWYAERKLVTVFWIHFVATMVVWTHFAMVKNEEQKNGVPEGAPNYYWKRIVPTLEFGSMHAILFQMALIPMTMARMSIAYLSTTSAQDYFPFDRMLRVHIHLGYVMVGIVFLSVIVFFTFFGHVCRDGEDSFCDKFTEEIMITGYIILAFLLVVGFTSYFRYNINYDWFYRIHHIVFLMYLVTVIHTQDNVERENGRNRSQTFKWFSATILYYLCDRSAMATNHRFEARVVELVAMTSGATRMIKLVLRRPVLFDFQPGQYAFLRLAGIEWAWHPFSIASGPESDVVEFYIEVFGPQSWTGKLWELAATLTQTDLMTMEIQGPYGTPLAKTADYSHALAFGSGTGVVPLLSFLKQHVRHLVRLEPNFFLAQHAEQEQKIAQLRLASMGRDGSAAKRSIRFCFPKKPAQSSSGFVVPKSRKRDSIHSSIKQHEELVASNSPKSAQSANIKDIKRNARFAMLPIYGIPLLGLLSVLGVLCVSLTLSFNLFLKHNEGWKGMDVILQVLTILFQSLFTLVAVCLWPSQSFFFYIDLSFIFINAFTDWYFFAKDLWLSMTGSDLAAYFVLVGYMAARAYAAAVGPRHMSWRSIFTDDGIHTLDRLDFVWVTRSASLASEVLPDLCNIWETLVSAWGQELALRVCRISVHVTDKDQASCEALQAEYGNRNVPIHFGRPDFPKLIQNHTIDMVCNRMQSHTVLAFSGSPKLASELHDMKLSNDITTSITGHTEHTMEFVSESYGGRKNYNDDEAETAQAPEQAPSDPQAGGVKATQPLTTTVVFNRVAGGTWAEGAEDIPFVAGEAGDLSSQVALDDE